MSEISYRERYTLSIKEAALYFNIGIKKMRRLAEENLGSFCSKEWKSILDYSYKIRRISLQ